jgi:hypothetical protein
MVTIAQTGWYGLTITPSGGGSAQSYYFKDDPQILLEGGWEDLPVAGLEGARHEAINTGFKRTVTLRVYDNGDEYNAIKSYITTPTVGSTAQADSEAATITITRQAGTGVSSFSFTALPISVTENPSNREGHNANVVFNCYTTVPTLT